MAPAVAAAAAECVRTNITISPSFSNAGFTAERVAKHDAPGPELMGGGDLNPRRRPVEVQVTKLLLHPRRRLLLREHRPAGTAALRPASTRGRQRPAVWDATRNRVRYMRQEARGTRQETRCTSKRQETRGTRHETRGTRQETRCTSKRQETRGNRQEARGKRQEARGTRHEKRGKKQAKSPPLTTARAGLR